MEGSENAAGHEAYFKPVPHIDEDADAWDDTALIDAYERALSTYRQDIPKSPIASADDGSDISTFRQERSKPPLVATPATAGDRDELSEPGNHPPIRDDDMARKTSRRPAPLHHTTDTGSPHVDRRHSVTRPRSERESPYNTAHPGEGSHADMSGGLGLGHSHEAAPRVQPNGTSQQEPYHAVPHHFFTENLRRTNASPQASHPPIGSHAHSRILSADAQPNEHHKAGAVDGPPAHCASQHPAMLLRPPPPVLPNSRKPATVPVAAGEPGPLPAAGIADAELEELLVSWYEAGYRAGRYVALRETRSGHRTDAQ